MTAVRSLVGTVGVVLAAVLLLLGLVLSPVLLPVGALALLVAGGWKFWRMKHKVEKEVHRGHRKVRKAGKKAGKKAGQALSG
jgi:hypothetical protein